VHDLHVFRYQIATAIDKTEIIIPPINIILFHFFLFFESEFVAAAPAPTIAKGIAIHAPQKSSLCSSFVILYIVLIFLKTHIKMKMLTINSKKNIPISMFLAISIIIIFLLYITTLIKTIPCGKNLKSVFLGNFIHLDFYHLLTNLYALYSLTRIEEQVGFKKFLALIVFILVFNTIIETIIHKIFPSIPCSIGFSGILFGLTSWEYITNNKLDLSLLSSIALVTIFPSLKDSKVSMAGHVVGSLSGIIAGILWNKVSPFKNN
jgi:membrane associated rhomboid family serine protease|tara:strand:- start:4686 stop:5474 length:789 start_codon:yes stop_codon:yes gene_type:complete